MVLKLNNKRMNNPTAKVQPSWRQGQDNYVLRTVTDSYFNRSPAVKMLKLSRQQEPRWQNSAHKILSNSKHRHELTEHTSQTALRQDGTNHHAQHTELERSLNLLFV